jgi:hypothetical protein
MKKVSLKEYAEHYNPERTRRGKRMSESYIYRLIRQDLGRDKKHPIPTRDLWFNYEMEGEKERIWIVLPN